MRLNWWAIVVSAIALFLFGWLWYDLLFGKLWMAEIARTNGAGATAQMMGASPIYLFSVDFITAFFLAYGLARILHWRGPVGPLEGAWIGFAFGLLIFGSMTWLDYVYSGWGVTLGFLNIGYVAVGMAIQGAILGAWRPKDVKAP
jgi:hypothetical protein